MNGFAWILNLDAECELAAPRGYTPRRSVLAQVNQNKLLLSSLTRTTSLTVRSTGAK